MPAEAWRGIAAGGLILVLGVLASVRHPADRHEPPPIPAHRCTDWMADAIPRVGVRRRAAVAAAIRRGEIPAAAQAWFSR